MQHRKATPMIVIQAKPSPAVPAVLTQAGEVIAPFDYGNVLPEHAALAREAVPFIEGRQKGMATAALEIGAKLNEVKAALGHGHFGSWLAASFAMSTRSAQTYMQAATAIGPKYAKFAHLPFSAVSEIARAPEPIREKVLEELETAPAPLSAKAVSDTIWTAQQEAKRAAEEAKKSPARRKREKAEREREREAWAVRKQEEARAEAARERAMVTLALFLRERLGDDAAMVADLLRKVEASTGSLASRLTDGLFGTDWQAGRHRQRTEPEWLEYLADLEGGPVR